MLKKNKTKNFHKVTVTIVLFIIRLIIVLNYALNFRISGKEKIAGIHYPLEPFPLSKFSITVVQTILV